MKELPTTGYKNIKITDNTFTATLIPVTTPTLTAGERLIELLYGKRNTK